MILFIKEDCRISRFVFSFRSQKTELHNEGYILELDYCASLDHLENQKLVPEFIKKVSPTMHREKRAHRAGA